MSSYRQFRSLLPLICILLIMITSSKVSEGFLSGSSNVPGVVVPSSIVITEGSTLAINCTLTNYAASTLRSEALYFTSVYNNVPTYVNNTYYHIRSGNTMEMVIPDVKREDGTTFKCLIADSNITLNGYDNLIAMASADIGEAPYPIQNISVISDNYDSMTVDWCPEIYQEDPVSSTLFWQIENATSYYSGNCSTWVNAMRKCSCVFCSSSALGVCSNEAQTFYRLQNYHISITSTNQFGSTSASIEVYTSPKIVKPGPVANLKVESSASRHMNISWQIPDHADFNVHFQISTSSKWGENFVIDVGSNMSWTLTNLTPHTNYAIAVRCKPVEDGYWSDNSFVSGVTLEDAPQVAPNVPIGFFRLSGCSDKCNVTIFWQLIDEKLQNGVILGYHLLVKSKYCSPCQDLFVPGSNRTSSIISLPSNSDSWAELSARTSVGDSPSQFIYFSSHFENLPNALDQGLYAEYTMNKAGVFFEWNYSEDVDNYTFMNCLGIQNDPNNCQNSPMEVLLPNNQTNYTMDPADPNLVYSLSANYNNGTNGLTAQWLCIYEYSGIPAKPKMHSSIQMSDTSIKISWDSLQCSSVNRVRVLHYVISYVPEFGADDAGENVTLPGSVSEYVVTGLVPESSYRLTIYAVARSGPGPNTTEDIKTTVPKSVNVVQAVAASVAVVVSVIVIIIVIVLCVKRSRRWVNDIKVKAPEKHTTNFPNEDSADCDQPYATVTVDSADLDGIASSPHTSINSLTLLAINSDNESSGPSTEISVICNSIESIQTYTAVRGGEISLETDDPNYSQVVNVTNRQLSSQVSNIDQPRPISFDQESHGSCGYSQGKLTDDKSDSDGLCNNSSRRLHSSVSMDSLGSYDNYKKTELRDCSAYELVGPPATPQIV